MTTRKPLEGRFFGTVEAMEADMRDWWRGQDENFTVVRWASRTANTTTRRFAWYVVKDDKSRMQYCGVEFATVSLHFTLPGDQLQYIMSRCRGRYD